MNFISLWFFTNSALLLKNFDDSFACRNIDIHRESDFFQILFKIKDSIKDLKSCFFSDFIVWSSSLLIDFTHNGIENKYNSLKILPIYIYKSFTFKVSPNDHHVHHIPFYENLNKIFIVYDNFHKTIMIHIFGKFLLYYLHLYYLCFYQMNSILSPIVFHPYYQMFSSSFMWT